VAEDGVVTLEVAEGVIETIEVRFFNDQGESVDEQGEPLRGYTHEYIITREFQTQPGDVFNQAQIERDFQRVFGLQIFEDVTPGLEPGSQNPRKVKVIVNVTERSTGSVAAGLGFNFTGDIFGTVSYRQDNFGGNNQKLTAEAQVSTRDLLFDVSFTDPWIAGDPFRTSYTATTFARRAINLNFDGGPNEINLSNGDRVRIRRLGGGITFSRPLDNGWTVAVGTLAQNVSARDGSGDLFTTDAAGNPLTASDTGVDDLWTIPLSASWDQRNDSFNPTSGGILRLTSEQSIPVGRGSILMNRLRASYSHYIPLRLINFTDGPQALAFNVQLGTILGDVPPYDAFSLGGTNSIRGYDEGETGSGRSYAQLTAEYRFPIFSFLGMALFFDAGSDLGSGGAVPGAPGPSRGKPGSGFGYGAGVRVQTPLGPLRIDYGFNDEGQGRLHFGIGERF
jgi:outer membrane protein insertion porin family